MAMSVSSTLPFAKGWIPSNFQMPNSVVSENQLYGAVCSEAAVKRTIQNNELLLKFDDAIWEGGPLDFLDAEELDPCNLPVPKRITLKEGIRLANSKAVNFYFRCESKYTDILARLIFKRLTNLKCVYRNTRQLYSNFLVEVILPNQDKLPPNFFHMYVLKYQHNAAKDKNFRLLLRDILQVVARCFKIDNNSLVNQLSLWKLERILANSENSIIEIPADVIKRQIEILREQEAIMQKELEGVTKK